MDGGTGPKCPHCGLRNMQRMGYSLYRCQNASDSDPLIYIFAVADDKQRQGYELHALEMALAMEGK